MSGLIFDNDQLREIVKGAILNALSPEKREALIGKAIEDLFKPADTSSLYGDRRSQIERAFAEAARVVAQEIFVERLRGPDRARLEKVVNKALTNALTDNGDQLARHFTDALIKTLRIE